MRYWLLGLGLFAVFMFWYFPSQDELQARALEAQALHDAQRQAKEELLRRKVCQHRPTLCQEKP